MPEDALAVAVSGGVDSAVLWRLCVRYQGENAYPVRLFPMAVDHGLRAESADEIAATGEATARDGHALIVLRPTSPIADMQGNVQQNARRTRYALMARECRRLGVAHLALAHHADDRAETALLALMRGAGLGGIGGMRPKSTSSEGIILLRPMLAMRKEAIIDYAKKNGVEWREDPSNASPKYMRNRLRAFLRELPDAAETVRRICASSVALQNEGDRAEEAAERLKKRHYTNETQTLSSRFLDEGEGDAMRLLRALFSDAGERPRERQVKLLFDALSLAVRRGSPRQYELGGKIFLYSPSLSSIKITPRLWK
ncbi:MAG: tRNA lysidine(34) synthetase TilS [Rickettsiales bacterium]